MLYNIQKEPGIFRIIFIKPLTLHSEWKVEHSSKCQDFARVIRLANEHAYTHGNLIELLNLVYISHRSPAKVKLIDQNVYKIWLFCQIMDAIYYDSDISAVDIYGTVSSCSIPGTFAPCLICLDNL